VDELENKKEELRTISKRYEEENEIINNLNKNIEEKRL
jgi:hypothetical protein